MAQHFQAVLSSNGFDLDLAKDQWLSLKLYSCDHKHKTSLSQAEFWVEVFTQVHPDDCNLSHVLMVIEINAWQGQYPHLAVKRGFSCIGRLISQSIKTHLTFGTIDMFMNICLNGPNPEEFTVARAVWQWNQTSQRTQKLISSTV